MFPEELAEAVADAVRFAFPAEPHVPATAIRIARPLRPEHGDFSTPVALRLARAAGRAAQGPAETIAAALEKLDGVERAWVAGAGHVNVRLTPEELVATARRLAVSGPRAGGADEAGGPGANGEPGCPAALRDALPGTPDPRVRELLEHLGMLVRGARALEVPEGPVDPDEPAGPDARRLICALAETGAVLSRSAALGPATRRGPAAAHDAARAPGSTTSQAAHARAAGAAAGGPRVGTTGRPHPLRTHLGELLMLWRRYEAGRTILPRGDEEPGRRHSAARLLTEATFRTVSYATLSTQNL